MSVGGEKFVFDEILWNSGVQFGCHAKQNALIWEVSNNSTFMHKKGFFLSAPLDSGEKGTIWNRIQFAWESSPQNNLEISCMALDQLTIIRGQEIISIQNYFEDLTIDAVEKETFFEELCQEKRYNVQDMYFTNLKGRYLWIKIAFTSYLPEKCSLQNFMVWYHIKPVTDYLPILYQEQNDFVKRFLAIFQSLYYDFQEQLDYVTQFLDVDCVSGTYLQWLAQWMGCVYPANWQDDKLRRFLKISFSLFQQKGTRTGLERLLTFAIGNQPILIELWKIMETCGEAYTRNGYDQLYGNAESVFWVLIAQEDLQACDMQELLQLIQWYQPIHTIAHIAVLKQQMLLGGHTYLGINSRIVGEMAYRLVENDTQESNSIRLQ